MLVVIHGGIAAVIFVLLLWLTGWEMGLRIIASIGGAILLVSILDAADDLHDWRRKHRVLKDWGRRRKLRKQDESEEEK